MKPFPIPLAVALIILLATALVACETPTLAPQDRAATEPTEVPATEPTQEPTSQPKLEPTSEPTRVPTSEPTEAPTPEATEAPTEAATAVPTHTPAPGPTQHVPTEATTTSSAPGGSLEGVDLPWASTYATHFRMLQDVVSQTPEVAEVLLGLSWMSEEFNSERANTLQFLMEISLQYPDDSPSFAEALASLDWLADDIETAEYELILGIYRLKDRWSPARIQTTLVNTIPGAQQPTSPPPPTRVPPSTLGPQQEISDLAWAQGSMSGIEQNALDSLRRMEQAHSDIAGVVLRFGWVSDNITDDEATALGHLRTLAEKFSLFGSSLGEVHDVLANTEWLLDSITRSESLFLRDLASVQDLDSIVASLLSNPYGHSLEDYTPAASSPAPTATPSPPSSASEFAWAQDGLTAIEREALGYLETIQQDELALDALVSNHRQWLADGINEDERRFLCIVATNPEQGTRYALLLELRPSPSIPACGS